MSQENEIKLEAILAPENQAETIALARALCPFAEEVTDAAMLICVAMVECGGDIDSIANYTGYERKRIRSHLQSHQCNKILRELSRHKLSGEGFLVAITNLIDVAGSQSQTGTARINASKSILELHEAEEGKSKGKHDSGLNLNEMTLSELQDYVDTIKADVALISGTPQKP